jgi:cytidylate kinase
MYRAATLLFLDHQQELTEENQPNLVRLLQEADLHLQNTVDEEGRLYTLVMLNGRDVTKEIRTQRVNLTVSPMSALPQIRPILIKKQQQLAQKFNVVMEGRDIGSNVLPHAQLKLFLTASLEERARRRFAQLRQSEPTLTEEQVKQQIVERDQNDMSRATNPLVIAPGARVVDTTNFEIGEVVDQIEEMVLKYQR